MKLKNLLLTAVAAIGFGLSVSSVQAADYSVETSELKAALANLTVDKSYKYCVAGTLTC